MDISSLLFNNIKNSLPSFNWNIGSVIRELIASPMVKVAETVSAELTAQSNKYTIDFLESTAVDNEGDIDILYDNLGLSVVYGSQATGVARIYVNTSDDIQIEEGTILSWEDQSLVVSRTVKASVTNVAIDILVLIGADSYYIDVPVTALTQGVNLSKGTPLVWGNAPTSVYEIVVIEAVLGGKDSLTALDKLYAIQNRLAPATLSLEQGLLKSLNSYNNSVVDVLFDTYADNSTGTTIYVQTVNPADIDSVREQLVSFTAGSPYNYTVKPPTYLELKISFSYLGSSVDSSALTFISDTINSLKMNTTSVNDTLLASLLQQRGLTLVGSAMYTVTDDTGAVIHQNGFANTQYLKKATTPYTLYLTLDNIQATNV